MDDVTGHGSPRGPAHAAAREVTTAALLATLLAVSSLLVIRVGPVPVTLQTLLVVLAALMLGPWHAALAVGTYLTMGAVGLPVFSGGAGGVGVLAGPTGGYLTGFALGAAAGSLIRRTLEGRRGPSPAADAAAALTVIAVVYTLGTLQLAAVAGMSPPAALAAGVVPFILPDAVKAALAIAAAGAIRRANRRR